MQIGCRYVLYSYEYHLCLLVLQTKNHNVLLHEMIFFLYYLTIQTLSIKKTKGLSLSNQNFDHVVSEYAIVHLHYSKTFFPIEAWTYLYIMAAAYILDFGINYGGQPPINLNGGSPIFIFFFILFLEFYNNLEYLIGFWFLYRDNKVIYLIFFFFHIYHAIHL